MENGGRKISALEIVLVKNEHVDLFASLFTLENDQAIVHGRVILGSEKKLCFSSDRNFKGALRSEFLSACRTIAEFYGAELLTRQVRMPASKENASSVQRLPIYAMN